MTKTEAVVENAQPTSHRDLPPLPQQQYADSTKYCSVLLFYQYVEPLWTSSQHRRALRKLMELCQSNEVTGRGRVAPEGMNCTLSGPAVGIRNVCLGLRDFLPTIFNETDFKITDGVVITKKFKSLSVRKTNELVAYGLKGDSVAPSLTKFAGTHLKADEYHTALQDPDAVVIDVRNYYETALGAFQPPPGGAKLIDPKLRNSIEFPKWLAAPETQKKLDGKKVLMYCTGGIRCERATALLNQMVVASTESSESGDDNNNNNSNNQETTTNDDNNQSKKKEGESSSSLDPVITCKPKGVFELRGGIERYVKTYPKGGFWKGKNYLFDRRMEQIPEGRDMADVEDEIDTAKCCLCRRKWTIYRGQYNCSSKLCGVPVIVCPTCTQYATQHPQELQCELCQENYRLTNTGPDLVEIKRKAEERTTSTTGSSLQQHSNQKVKKRSQNNDSHDAGEEDGARQQQRKRQRQRENYYEDRIFVSRLPLTATVTKLKQLLLPSTTTEHQKDRQERQWWLQKQKQQQEFRVHWLRDRRTNAFYGSCIVQMPSAESAKDVVERAAATDATDSSNNNNTEEKSKGLRMDKKRIKISYVWKKDGGTKEEVEDDNIFGASSNNSEYPPIQ